MRETKNGSMEEGQNMINRAEGRERETAGKEMKAEGEIQKKK